MNLSIKIYFAVFVFFMTYLSVFAHSPYEISYEINLNQEHPTLTVHLTPKTALDLVSYLKPELANQTVIKLDDYTKEYTEYINENLLVFADEQAVHFIFQQANLSQHDATLVFTIAQLPALASHFKLTANCFTDIYRKPQNIIKLQLPSGQQTFYLTKQNRQCTTSVKIVATKMKEIYALWAIGLLISGSIGIYFFNYFRQQKNHYLLTS